MTDDIKVSKNFMLSEFVSPDTNEVKATPGFGRLVKLLQQLRDQVGKPVTVTSGYRTPEHNAAVGGAAHSYHMQGLAADIVIAGMTSAQIAEVAKAVGFTGIGIYPTRGHCHVDVRPGPQVVFLGDK